MNPMNKASKTAIIAVAFAAVLGIAATPLLTPQADAVMSNGGFQVRSVDMVGNEGLAGRAPEPGSGNGGPVVEEPKPMLHGRIIAGRGSTWMAGDCTNASCAKFVLTVRDNLNPGPVSVGCNATGPRGGIAFKTVQATLPANGSVEISCVFGQPGEEVWITIDGQDYERSVWK